MLSTRSRLGMRARSRAKTDASAAPCPGWRSRRAVSRDLRVQSRLGHRTLQRQSESSPRLYQRDRPGLVEMGKRSGVLYTPRTDKRERKEVRSRGEAYQGRLDRSIGDLARRPHLVKRPSLSFLVLYSVQGGKCYTGLTRPYKRRNRVLRAIETSWHRRGRVRASLYRLKRC